MWGTSVARKEKAAVGLHGLVKASKIRCMIVAIRCRIVCDSVPFPPTISFCNHVCSLINKLVDAHWLPEGLCNGSTTSYHHSCRIFAGEYLYPQRGLITVTSPLQGRAFGSTRSSRWYIISGNILYMNILSRRSFVVKIKDTRVSRYWNFSFLDEMNSSKHASGVQLTSRLFSWYFRK